MPSTREPKEKVGLALWPKLKPHNITLRAPVHGSRALRLVQREHGTRHRRAGGACDSLAAEIRRQMMRDEPMALSAVRTAVARTARRLRNLMREGTS